MTDTNPHTDLIPREGGSTLHEEKLSSVAGQQAQPTQPGAPATFADGHAKFATIIKASRMRDNVFLSSNYAINVRLFNTYFPPDLEFIERQRMAAIEFRAKQERLDKERSDMLARLLSQPSMMDVSSYFASGNFDRDNEIQLPEYGWRYGGSRQPISYDEMQLVRDMFVTRRSTGYVILLTIGGKVKLEWMPVYKDGFEYPWLVACWKINSGFSMLIISMMEMLIADYDIAEDVMNVSESGSTEWIASDVDTTLAIVNKFLTKKGENVVLLHPQLSQQRLAFLDKLAQLEEMVPADLQSRLYMPSYTGERPVR